MRAAVVTAANRSARRPIEWPVLAVLLVGTANFSWQLGSSSLYIDESLAWHPAMLSFHGLYQSVHDGEISPPGYYALLHEWIYRLSSQQEWVMRIPSVLAGLGLVAAVYWLATLVADRRTAVLASLGAAISPLVLAFAQEARAYVFTMLFVTVATAGLLEGRRRPRGRVRVLWLLTAGTATIAAFWTHYTADLVLVPLLAWFAWRPGISKQGRLTLPLLSLAADLPLAPLLRYQLSQGHEDGIAGSANLGLGHVLRTLATPFDGRFDAVTVQSALGSAIVGFTLTAIATGLRGRGSRLLREVVVPGALIPLLAVYAVTIFAKPVLLTRYTAVAAPFLLILIAFVIVHGARWLAILIGAGALAAALWGTALTHSRSGFSADLRGAMGHIAHDRAPSDFIFVSGYPAAGTLDYSRTPRLAAAPIIYPDRATTLLPAIIRRHGRLWLLSSGNQTVKLRDVQQALTPLRYRTTELNQYPGTPELTLVLAVPR